MNFLIIGQLNNGEVEKLEKYLNTKKKTFLSVGFDSYLQNKNNIKIELFKNGISIKKNIYKYFFFNSKNKLIVLINFFLLFISIINKIDFKSFDIGIGISLFPSIICYYLKIKKKISKFVFYSQDYYMGGEKFFEKIYNKIFQYLDTHIYIKSDKVWCSSIKLDKLRNKIPLKKKIGKTLILTNGFFADFTELSAYNPNSKIITFVGTISDNQSLKELLEIAEKLNRKFNIIINIIGSGPASRNIKKIIDFKNLNNIVKFFGFVKDLKVIQETISQSALCYAVYTNRRGDNSHIASVGKLTLYTCLNRPSILSEHLVLAPYYKKYKCGVLTNSAIADIYIQIENFFENKNLRIEMQKNLKKIRGIWLTERRYDRAFKNLAVLFDL